LLYIRAGASSGCGILCAHHWGAHGIYSAFLLEYPKTRLCLSWISFEQVIVGIRTVPFHIIRPIYQYIFCWKTPL
jgi:hypothetical protein